jgi:polysaccharide export outer membrane protein
MTPSMRSIRSLVVAALLTLPSVAVAQRGRTSEPFQVGDRILLVVEGDTTLSDTFTVVAGPAIELPVIGAVSLAGVARTNLEAHLVRELGRYLKSPVVHARPLIRLSILGSVLRPGFYAVPTDLVLADALMIAGGPTQEARADKLRIHRGGGVLWAGPKLQAEIARGATLEDLGLRAGDRVEVPKGRDVESTVRIVGALVTIPIALCVLTKGC